MSYEDVDIEDVEWNEELQACTYPCPFGDLFQITEEEHRPGEEIARCPSCSLYITVIYNAEDFLGDESEEKIGIVELKLESLNGVVCRMRKRRRLYILKKVIGQATPRGLSHYSPSTTIGQPSPFAIFNNILVEA